MTLDHLRQQITIVMDDLPVLEAEAAACDDLARHLVVRLKIAAENATGCAILADADCYTSLATVLRSILEGLFVTYWASLNEENGQKILGSLKNEGARLLRNMLQSRRGVIRRKSTGDDVTGEFLKSDFIAEATRPNRINKMAEEAGLGELYFIF